MKHNHYISRYNAGETHFNRTDPWKHVPFDFEVKKPSLLKDVAIFSACIAVIILSSFLVRM